MVAAMVLVAYKWCVEGDCTHHGHISNQQHVDIYTGSSKE